MLAVAIMSNHLHLVVQQGEWPLSELMQPLLRRLARLIQKAHGVDGPIFWRPFGAEACLDPRHARNAIAYTHLNPVRAGLCSDPGEYPWTSHAMYAGTTPPFELEALVPRLDPSIALPLFAGGRDRSADVLKADYRAFVDWRLEIDRRTARRDGDSGDDPADPRPWERWAEPGWGDSLSPLFHAPSRVSTWRRRNGAAGLTGGVPDAATIAKNVLSYEGSGLPMSAIRGRGGGRERTRLRHAVVHRLHAAGYRNVEIAPFVGLSQSAVSHIIRAAQALEVG